MIGGRLMPRQRMEVAAMEKKCAACGRVFEARSNAQRFCSRGCRLTGPIWGQQQSCRCALCSAPFSPRISTQRYCSRACAAIVRKTGGRALRRKPSAQPSCRLEQTVLLAQQAGMSYGQYSVYRFLGWL